MSDPKREDLRVLKPCNLDPASPSSQHRHTEDVTDAEFDAIARLEGYVPREWFDACAEESRQRYARIQELERR